MKKFMFYAIGIILIFSISVYIGLKFDIPNEEAEQEIEIGLNEENVRARRTVPRRKRNRTNCFRRRSK